MLRVVLLLATATVAATAAQPSVTVTRDSLDLPANCSPREVATVVSRFLGAFNAGDERALDSFMAREGDDPPRFQWFTLDRDGVYLRSGAIPYLKALRASGVELELEEIDVSRSWVRGGVGVSYRLRRVDGTGSVSGKGEIHCPSGTIYVWSMATGVAAPICEGEGGDAVLACSRAGRRPNGQETAAELEVGSTQVRLPPACGVGAAQVRILRTLRAFNLRDGKAAALNFAPKGSFHLYTSEGRRGAVGRAAIAARVDSRAAAGDALTLVALRPPANLESPPRRAIYGITLRVNEVLEGGVKVIVDCRSGLLTVWVGPAMKAPS